MIKKRSIALVILLSFVTFGIYPLILMCIMGEEVNRICEGDGKKNMFYLLAVLLGFVTLFIYPVIWCCKAMNRLQDNAYRYGPTVNPAHSGGSFVLWTYLGTFIGVGSLVAFAYFVSDVNAFADIYGNIAPLPYTYDKVQRVAMLQNANFLGYANNAALPQGNYAPPQQNYVQPQMSAPPYQQSYLPQPGAPVIDNQNIDAPAETVSGVDSIGPTAGRKSHTGVIRGLSGMYQGFDFPIENNEEILIGTDPAQASIVVDANSSYISRRHCSIQYDAMQNVYLVTDYSSNGTYTADGIKINSGIPKMLNRGEKIYLGTTDNMFQLG